MDSPLIPYPFIIGAAKAFGTRTESLLYEDAILNGWVGGTILYTAPLSRKIQNLYTNPVFAYHWLSLKNNVIKTQLRTYILLLCIMLKLLSKSVKFFIKKKFENANPELCL